MLGRRDGFRARFGDGHPELVNRHIHIHRVGNRALAWPRVVTFTEIGKTERGRHGGGEIKSLLMGISGLRCSLETQAEISIRQLDGAHGRILQ